MWKKAKYREAESACLRDQFQEELAERRRVYDLQRLLQDLERQERERERQERERERERERQQEPEWLDLERARIAATEKLMMAMLERM